MDAQLREVLLALGAALGAGLLIGAEREQSGGRPVFAGVRTFPLIALMGALAMLVGPWLVALCGVFLGALVATAYVRDTAGGEHLGISTEVATMLTYGLGALATARDLPLAAHDRLQVVGVAAVAVLGLLASRRSLHGVIAKVSPDDIAATVKLLAFAVVVLPLLPDRDLGPWDALNPRRIGWLVLLIAGIGLVGYVSMRLVGSRRGIGLTGLLGGLASSTAVTLAFAPRAKNDPTLATACAVGVVVASSTMFPRIIAEVAATDRGLLSTVAWPLGAAALAGYAAAGALYVLASKESSAKGGDGDVAVTNPFSLGSAMKFAALFTVILVANRAASQYLGHAGTYLAAVISGTTDVDAITLSLAGMHRRGGLDASTAANGIALAAATNTAVKVGMSVLLGGRAFAARVAPALLVALVVGGVVRALV